MTAVSLNGDAAQAATEMEMQKQGMSADEIALAKMGYKQASLLSGRSLWARLHHESDLSPPTGVETWPWPSDQLWHGACRANSPLSGPLEKLGSV